MAFKSFSFTCSVYLIFVTEKLHSFFFILTPSFWNARLWRTLVSRRHLLFPTPIARKHPRVNVWKKCLILLCSLSTIMTINYSCISVSQLGLYPALQAPGLRLLSANHQPIGGQPVTFLDLCYRVCYTLAVKSFDELMILCECSQFMSSTWVHLKNNGEFIDF